MSILGKKPKAGIVSCLANTCRSLVAQIGNLLYRRLAVGRASKGRKAPGVADSPQNAILRHSRLTICATGNRRHSRRFPAIPVEFNPALRLRAGGAPGRGDFRSVLARGLVVFLLTANSLHAAPQRQPDPVALGPGGRLVYRADARGNRIPDFSHCGYAGADRPIPDAPIRVVVAPMPGDSTARIQRAIDYVGGLPEDTKGLRGTVLLLKGRHEVLGSLQLNASGVVLRGQGMGEDGTVLVAAGEGRRTLIRIAGRSDQTSHHNALWRIRDDYVPVGATSFQVEDASRLKAGDTINVIRPCTQAWIDRLGMTQFGGGFGDWRTTWHVGTRDLTWDRVIESIDGNRVIVDAPITTAIDKEFGGGRVETYSWPGRIRNVGVENLRLESTFDPANPKDENHSWMAITMENADNAWVRQVTGSHFAGSLVAIYESCKWVTVEDCRSLAPVSEEAGYRRNTFFTMGQMTLFLRCWAEHGRHDFSAGHCAAGPNAFVQCEDLLASRDSGPLESWASGVVYDNVRIDGNALSLANRGTAQQGAGWSAANSVLWQCSAALLRCENPPTAQNWAFGCWGEFEGDGIWRNSNEFVEPESLYVAQLTDRLGRDAGARVQLMSRSTAEATNPSLGQAAALIAASRKPAPQLSDYIAQAAIRNPIPAEAGDAPDVRDIKLNPTAQPPVAERHPLVLTNGWLTVDNRLLTGRILKVNWWRGTIRPGEAGNYGVNLTRFAPGRSGPGLSDDLNRVADGMIAADQAALDYHYGLWYDRRREDHERVRRMTGDVWAPFYEQPFARSGQGTAWDGLSRYDLTKYNPWYWSRLKRFADICDERGLVLFNQDYFQHNVLEAGAHWADFPWRSANNINHTGFPEPPPYAGDKRIFMAEQFYDVANPVRRALHRAYIRQCLDNFAGNSNVIQFTSAEFTGPLEFVQFWLDTIAEWERETGRKPLVALSCTKDVQDSILADPRRSEIVNVVDFRYWWQTDKGLFAPKGGQNLSPRQFERRWKGGRPDDLDLAQMAAEYRPRHPDKAIICDFDQGGWAFLCAGGSIPTLPETTDLRLLQAIPRLQPWPAATSHNRWVLSEPGRQYLVFLGPGASAELDLSREKGSFTVRSVDLRKGITTELPGRLNGGQTVTLPKKDNGRSVLWLTIDK